MPETARGRHDGDRSQRRRVADLYTRSAQDYQDLWAQELVALSRQLLPHLPLEGARAILEGGAGVGSLLPELRARAPEALIVASDLTLGMLQLAPREFPRAVMDASALAVKDGSFDVGILAFVLFHLPEPARGIAEVARALRPGGVVGTVTWGDEHEPRALRIWAEELDAHGAPPPDPDFARFELVDTPAKVEDMMTAEGLLTVRSWIGERRSVSTPAEFIAHRTRHGRSRQRFEAMPVEARERCLHEVRTRLEDLGPKDLEERSEVVYVVAQKS